MLKKMKLATKLSGAIGGILLLIFTILIVATVFLSKTAISNSIYGELTAVSKNNAREIQSIFSSAGSVASDMEYFLENAYKKAEADPSLMEIPTDPDTAKMCQSMILNKTLSSLNYDVENYMIESSRNAAKNNEAIDGVGVMFEPNKFQDDIRDYSFYIREAEADNEVQMYAAYESYAQEPYYLQAKNSKKSVVTDPYGFEGVQMVSFAVPILYNNEVQGVIVSDIGLDEFNQVEASSDGYKSMFANIFNSDGEIIYDSENSESIGSTLSTFTNDTAVLSRIQAEMSQGVDFQSELVRSDNGNAVTLFFSPISAGSDIWWAMTAINTSDVNASVVKTVIWLISLSVISLAVIVFSIFFLLKRMLAPMNAVVQAADQIAEGNLNVNLRIDAEDEIGLLSDSFQRMSQHLKMMVGDLSDLLKQIADGNFNIKTNAEEAYVGEFRPMLMTLQDMTLGLSATMSQIHEAANQVSSGSEQVSSGAQELSQGTAQQASSVDELAATINEISDQVNNNAESARTAQTSVALVGGNVTECNQQMQQMTKAMDEISISSGEIGKILKTIEDIAFQTNILALNAAVEAARAGAAGKGFAVVADEVRTLAGKVSEASKNTASLIETSLKAVESGTDISAKAAKSLQAVVKGAQEITSQINSIADATDAQAMSLFHIREGIDQIAHVVQSNSATAEESAAASEELSGQAQLMKGYVDKFRLSEEHSEDVNPASKPLSNQEIHKTVLQAPSRHQKY